MDSLRTIGIAVPYCSLTSTPCEFMSSTDLWILIPQFRSYPVIQ